MFKLIVFLCLGQFINEGSPILVSLLIPTVMAMIGLMLASAMRRRDSGPSVHQDYAHDLLP